MSKKRILYAVVGVVVMLFAGFIYAWSVLSSYISAEYPHWPNGALSLTFTICMAFFCLGGLAAGILSKKIPVKYNVRISAVLYFVGFILASKIQSLPGLYISYGVLCGSGTGFAYNSVINVMPRWFPDTPGLISGFLLMGFGSSSLIIGTAFTSLTSTDIGAWRDSFFFMGILIPIIMLIGSFFFVIPTADQIPSSKASAKTVVNNEGIEVNVKEMIRRPSFYQFFIWSTLLSGMGLAIIAQAKPIAAIVAPELSAGTVSLVVGLISVFNGLGRIIIGAIVDRKGRKSAMFVVNIVALLSAFILIGAIALNYFPLIVLGFLGAGIAYGGCPSMSASFVRLFYGNNNYPVNFSIMNLNLLVASLFSTLAGVLYDTSGSYMTTFMVLAVSGIISLIILPTIKKA